MKLCRYGNDQLGVVIDGTVRDVTAAQTEIRAAARYDMKGDAVIAALPEWRDRLQEMAEKAAPVPVDSVDLLSPVARPGKLMAAIREVIQVGIDTKKPAVKETTPAYRRRSLTYQPQPDTDHQTSAHEKGPGK